MDSARWLSLLLDIYQGRIILTYECANEISLWKSSERRNLLTWSDASAVAVLWCWSSIKTRPGLILSRDSLRGYPYFRLDEAKVTHGWTWSRAWPPSFHPAVKRLENKMKVKNERINSKDTFQTSFWPENYPQSETSLEPCLFAYYPSSRRELWLWHSW